MDGSVCAIVGAGSGISMAAARRFGREGYHVALLARRSDALAAYVAELGAAGIAASGHVANAADGDSLRAAFADVTAQAGPTDVLIYNPAGYVPGPASQMDAAAFAEALQVSVVGALVAAQQVIPTMRQRGRGSILMTGGGLALDPTPMPEYAGLAAGKAALRNLAYSFAAELGPVGIHVATVTVAGIVRRGTHHDPDDIAEAFWALHRQPAGAWETEVIVR